MAFKLLLAQPAIPRFQWELEVLLTNIRQFTDMEVILLFTEKDFTVPIFFREKYGCSVFTFTDTRDDTSYIPSIRPWLLWQYFEQHPEAVDETYFYIDSDIIFREWPDFTTSSIKSGQVVGADCSGYLDAKYVSQCELGADILAKMAEICGVSVEAMQGVPGIGAQLIFKNILPQFWKRCYFDSNELYHYLEEVGGDIQKWTAEMWVQLWGWVREGLEVVVSDELAFCRPTDDIGEWDKVKILHNAGVTSGEELFFKGAYSITSPLGQDFSYVRSDKASKKYVEAIARVL